MENIKGLHRISYEDYGDYTITLYTIPVHSKKLSLVKHMFNVRRERGEYIGEVGSFRCSCEHDCCGCNISTSVEFGSVGDKILISVIDHYNY